MHELKNRASRPFGMVITRESLMLRDSRLIDVGNPEKSRFRTRRIRTFRDDESQQVFQMRQKKPVNLGIRSGFMRSAPITVLRVSAREVGSAASCADTL